MIEALMLLVKGGLKSWKQVVAAVLLILAIYAGQFFTSSQIADAAKENAVVQTKVQARALAIVRSDIQDIHDDIENNAQEDSVRFRKIERKIDRLNNRVNDIDENGTEGGNERIDEILRAVSKRKK